jgi:hypothetical protein
MSTFSGVKKRVITGLEAFRAASLVAIFFRCEIAPERDVLFRQTLHLRHAK